jgi:hypothetical protein
MHGETKPIGGACISCFFMTGSFVVQTNGCATVRANAKNQ